MLNARTQQTLLLDADDTLWENNIYFERAIAAFISFLDHAFHTPAEVRERLNRVERETIAERGYGTESFRISLIRCFEEMSETSLSEVQHQCVMSFADAIVTAEIELIKGVREALAVLAREHRLILVTKGDSLEQRDKLERSGLEVYFAAVEVLPEKTAEAYREIGARHACLPEATWMIGNSPRSDINPALAAGFHAIFIPHSDTWILEDEELSTPIGEQRLLRLERLDQLPEALLSGQGFK
jgi:putative hydrolase of the HAD superfamily